MMIELSTISVALGLFVGFIMALTGAGGSVLAIPLLTFGLGLSFTEAAPIALLAVMSGASIGSIQGLHKGTVRYKTALLISGFGIALAPLGVLLAKHASTQVLSLSFGVVLIYVAWYMWTKNTEALHVATDKPPSPCEINPATSKLFWTAYCTKRLAVTGAISGLLSGLLGVGGGFVIVPSLQKVSNFDFQTIIATSLTIIALVSAGAVITHLLHSGINWAVAVPFVISTMVSMLAFRMISHKIPTTITQRLFAIFAIFAASLMLIQSFS
ncbi:MAG: sulfite exporter TauE/SafE family protein [Methylophilaceae bacterium]